MRISNWSADLCSSDLKDSTSGCRCRRREWTLLSDPCVPLEQIRVGWNRRRRSTDPDLLYLFEVDLIHAVRWNRGAVPSDNDPIEGQVLAQAPGLASFLGRSKRVTTMARKVLLSAQGKRAARALRTTCVGSNRSSSRVISQALGASAVRLSSAGSTASSIAGSPRPPEG